MGKRYRMRPGVCICESVLVCSCVCLKKCVCMYACAGGCGWVGEWVVGWTDGRGQYSTRGDVRRWAAVLRAIGRRVAEWNDGKGKRSRRDR